MTRRYFVADLPNVGGLVTLSESESHHAIHVMRIKPGDSVELFDGKGKQSQAIVSAVDRKLCHCQSEEAVSIDREPKLVIHLGVALPKPDRSRELVERLTEIGVKSLTPIVAQRSQRPPSDSLLDKLRKGVVEACKQSGRNELLQVNPTVDASEYFASKQTIANWIAHPANDAEQLGVLANQALQEVTVAIGPEGGWSETEFEMAVSQGFAPVQLGKRIYRIETAATVIASVLASVSERDS